MFVSLVVSWRLALCDSPYVLVLYITTTPTQVQALTQKNLLVRCSLKARIPPTGEAYGAQAVVCSRYCSGPRRRWRSLDEAGRSPRTRSGLFVRELPAAHAVFST